MVLNYWIVHLFFRHEVEKNKASRDSGKFLKVYVLILLQIEIFYLVVKTFERRYINTSGFVFREI